ncbi:MAG: hypothetical protein JST59_26450 [Actinobacteria bacterium]|nr:hypothetical protein [Actinomycetota bacterium]
MRVRTAIAIVILVATLVAGCGGSAPAKRGAEEDGGVIVEESGGPRDVQEGEMVAGEEGWVRSGLGVFWTRNGGRSWRPITPPVPDGFDIAGVYFANPRLGWAMSDKGPEDDVRTLMNMTTDGGRTWHHTRLHATGFIRGATQVSFSLVGAHDLFALAREEGDTASNFGVLLVSHDSGRHWRALPPQPKAGRVSFETPLRGWLAVGWPGRGLYRTADGGRTWVAVQPGKPLDAPTPKGREPGLHEAVWGAYYTTPLIGPNGHGILGMVESTEKAVLGETAPSQAVVLRTADHGRSWHRTAKIKLPNVSGVFDASYVFARQGRSRSYLFRRPISGAHAVVGPDGHVGPLRPSRGLTRYWQSITLSDATHGFAFPYSGNGPSLVVTRDGGDTWNPVSAPRAAP